jgi:hypothetical protein
MPRLRVGPVAGSNVAAVLRKTSVLGVLGILAVGSALAVSVMVSDARLQGHGIKLTSINSLPAGMLIGGEQRVQIGISNDNAESYQDASLVLEISGGGSLLSDPSIVHVTFKDPDTGDELPVALTATSGSLRGIMKSGWTMPVGYAEIGEFGVRFNERAPLVSYSFAVWVEDNATVSTSVGTAREVAASES